MSIRGVIFDLDGVIVSTDDFHYLAWQRLADEEGIPFDRTVNQRQRGVSRMESLDVLLERSSREYSTDEKLVLAERKNGYYRESLGRLTPSDILPGVEEMLEGLERLGVKTAVGSSSRNTPFILERIGMAGSFDAVADGNDITKSKPDPEVFLIAALRLGLRPEECLVVEDAMAGIDAALAGGMRAFAVGFAAGPPGAHGRAESLEGVTAEDLIRV